MTTPPTVDLAEPIARESEDLSSENSIGYRQARIGLIVPSGNRLTEEHFRHFLPREVGLHTARLRMTGEHSQTFDKLIPSIHGAATLLGDVGLDLIGFHCNATSMEHGLDGDAKMLETITEASGVPAISTAQAAVAALRALNIKKMVLVTPYDQKNNDHETAYLHDLGFEVLDDVALDSFKDGLRHFNHSPARWIEVTRQAARDDADGYYLSCTNTTQIDVIERLERELGKPVLNSNQAMIWACLHRIAGKAGPVRPIPGLGSLMSKPLG